MSGPDPSDETIDDQPAPETQPDPDAPPSAPQTRTDDEDDGTGLTDPGDT